MRTNNRNRSCLPVRSAVLGVTGAMAMALGLAQLWAADPPEVPAVSDYASTKALLHQVKYYIGRVESSLGKTSYSTASQARVVKDAQSLTLLFLALGLHEEDSPLKANASELVKTANTLRKDAEDHAKSKADFAAVKKAMAAKGTGANEELKWDVDLIDLHALMKQVSTVSSRVRINTNRQTSLDRRREETAAKAALLAVMAQAAFTDTREVKDKAQLDEWYKFSSALRDSAGKISWAVSNNENLAVVTEAVTSMRKSCTECHKVFRPDLN